MKNFRTILFSLVSFYLVCCTSDKKPKPDEVNTVYICTGVNATVFHSTDQCNALSNCSGEIKQVGIAMASTTREPCDRCFDNSTINSTPDNERKEPRLKKYVYLDRQNVLHYTLNCDVLQPIEENHTEEYAISFIEIDNSNMPPHWYCSRCFTNRRYEEISKRIHQLPDTLNHSE